MLRSKVILATALYLIGVLGVHGQVHFCCGHIIGFEWNVEQGLDHNQIASCCKKEACCSVIVIDEAIEDEHQAGRVDINSSWVSTPMLTSHTTSWDCAWGKADFQSSFLYRGPPPLSGRSRVCLYHNWKMDSIA
jgi:hypothetical protein